MPNFADYRGGLTAIVSAVFTLAVLVLAVGGVARIVFARRAIPAPERRSLLKYELMLSLPVVYFTLVHCVFIGSLRYRVPLMPLLALAAGVALMRISELCSEPKPAAQPHPSSGGDA